MWDGLGTGTEFAGSCCLEALLFIAGMMLTGIMNSLWQFYLFFGVVLGVSTAIFTVLPVSGVTLWFRKHLGVAMGVVWFVPRIGHNCAPCPDWRGLLPAWNSSGSSGFRA